METTWIGTAVVVLALCVAVYFLLQYKKQQDVVEEEFEDRSFEPFEQQQQYDQQQQQYEQQQVGPQQVEQQVQQQVQQQQQQVQQQQVNEDPNSNVTPSPADQGVQVTSCGMGPAAAEAMGQNEQYKAIDAVGNAGQGALPKDCYPKDQLTPQELLPADANSTWAQVNPAGQGDLKDQNFLNAGHHIGINTVGQTLRNANWGLRSEPPNPQVKVSPWMQTTIEPDTNRRAMEMGGEGGSCN